MVARALAMSAVFKELRDTAIEQILEIASLRRYSSRACISTSASATDDVLLVVAGCVEVSCVSASGGKHVLAVEGAGEVMALVRLLPGALPKYDYFVHPATVLLHLPAAAFREVLDREPMLWRDVAMLALRRHRESIETLRRLALGDLRDNVVQLLLKLSDVYLRGGQLQGVIPLPQHQIACMLGVSRQTLNKELRVLADQGLVAPQYGQLQICDLGSLRRIGSSLR